VSGTNAIQDAVTVVYATGDKCMYHLNDFCTILISRRWYRNVCLTDGRYALQRSLHCHVGASVETWIVIPPIVMVSQTNLDSWCGVPNQMKWVESVFSSKQLALIQWLISMQATSCLTLLYTAMGSASKYSWLQSLTAHGSEISI